MRALLFALVFYPATLVFVLSGMTASLVGTAPMHTVVLGWSRFHGWLTRMLGIRVRFEGAIPSGPHLIAVKHQSMFETVELVRFAQSPIMVVKRELAFMPLFGWMTRCYGVIPVDRDAGPKAIRELLKSAQDALAQNRPVIIYPEGTRVPFGEAPELRSGFAGLYRALGLPVVPIAHDGGRIWGPSLPRSGGTVTFRVGETIPAGLKRDEVERRVHAAINALTP
jgi:1-acyl-sn-glycerol-3-phosphate acyltransferase